MSKACAVRAGKDRGVVGYRDLLAYRKGGHVEELEAVPLQHRVHFIGIHQLPAFVVYACSAFHPYSPTCRALGAEAKEDLPQSKDDLLILQQIPTMYVSRVKRGRKYGRFFHPRDDATIRHAEQGYEFEGEAGKAGQHAAPA